MAFLGNPLINQGQLNRVLVHAVVPSNAALSVTAPFMSKSMAVLTFEDNFTDQIPTATGIVNSPAIYTMGTLVLNLLRTQAVAGLWIAQAQLQATIGDVQLYSDTTNFPQLTMTDSSIMGFDPGAYDGTDPTVKVTVKGVFPINVFLWAGGGL